MTKYKELCIGIDESYDDTGITLNYDNGRKVVPSHIRFEDNASKTEKRAELRKAIEVMLKREKTSASSIIIVVERIRQFSGRFISMPYIKSMAALIANIVDPAFYEGIKVYSVDTRCWKANIVGTSKPMKNKMGIDDKKFPTIRWAVQKGYRDYIKERITKVNKKTKKETTKIIWNDNVADSIGISFTWWNTETRKRLLEET